MEERLIFRRQFIITRNPLVMFKDWRCMKISQYYLHTHPDLDVNRENDTKKSIVLIGSLFDPTQPEKRNAEILKYIFAGFAGLENLFSQIKRYAGSYALFYTDNLNAIILNDALTLREIYYCTNNNQIVCGSQPNLVAKFSNPTIKETNNPDLLEYYAKNADGGRWNPECVWIGDETLYDGIKHVMPNHYLDINRRECPRYWPNEPIRPISLENAVSRGCTFLKGSVKAMVNRHPVMMAVTSGTDSRTLLAASQGLTDKIYFFINQELGMGDNHPDIAVPKAMFKQIGLPFHIHDVPTDVDKDFRKIFLNNTFYATERHVPTVYSVYYKTLCDKVNLLGIGEIGRTRFGKAPVHLNGYRMAHKLGYKKDIYATKMGEQILAELLPVSRMSNVNIMTLFYWEHYLGNWGPTGNSESDIAIEEINPMDSHLLYEIFLGVDTKYADYYNPILFQEMIRTMWPKLLDFPFNPPHTVRGRIIRLLQKVGLLGILKEMRYHLNYYQFQRSF